MSKFDLETLLFSSEKNHLTQLTLLAYLHTSGVNHQQDMVGFDKAKIKKWDYIKPNNWIITYQVELLSCSSLLFYCEKFTMNSSFFYRSYEYCNFIYKKQVKAHLLRGYLPGDPPIPEQMFCAGSNSDPNIRTERGDSGGPVFVKTRYLNIILLLF